MNIKIVSSLIRLRMLRLCRTPGTSSSLHPLQEWKWTEQRRGHTTLNPRQDRANNQVNISRAAAETAGRAWSENLGHKQIDGLKLDWCSSEVDISIDTIRYAVVLVMNRK